MNIKILFYRTLSSQSAASVSCGCLATALRHMNHQVEIHLLNPYKNELNKIDFTHTRYVFYKVNFKDVKFLKRNISIIRKQNSKIKLILLGPYTFFWKDILLKDFKIDAILLPNCESNISLDLRNNIYLTQQRPTIHDNYKQLRDYSCVPSRDIETKEPLKIVNIEAARGCYNNCSFCHVSQICNHFQKRIFRRLPDEVLSEIENLQKMGKKYFIFNDPVLWGRSQIFGSEIQQFCEKSALLNNTYFMAYLNLSVLSERSIQLLEKGHFIRLFIGLETSDSDALKIYNKNVQVNTYARTKKLLLKHHIVPHIGFMLYHPYTSIKEIVQNIQFLYEVDELHRFGVVYEKMRVFPHTDLYSKLERDKLLVKKSSLSVDYLFKDRKVQNFYNYFVKNVATVNLAIFERIEYIFTCAEFVNNFVKLKKKNSYSKDIYNVIQKLRWIYSKVFLQFVRLSLKHRNVRYDDAIVQKLMKIYVQLEKSWTEFINIVTNNCLSNPLEWIANGSYEPERDKDQTNIIRTRSGCIRRNK